MRAMPQVVHWKLVKTYRTLAACLKAEPREHIKNALKRIKNTMTLGQPVSIYVDGDGDDGMYHWIWDADDVDAERKYVDLGATEKYTVFRTGYGEGCRVTKITYSQLVRNPRKPR